MRALAAATVLLGPLVGCSSLLRDGVDGEVGVVEGGLSGEFPPEACLDAAASGTLGAWLGVLDDVARAAPAAVGPALALGLFQLPGVSPGPWFLLDLAPCSDDEGAAPFCTEGVCYATACDDQGWTAEATNDEADALETTFGEWSVTGATVTTTWSEDRGADVTFAVDALVSDRGADWRFTGSGTLDGALTLDASFPALGEGLVVTLVDGQGSVASWGFPVATWTDGALAPVADCADAG